MLTGCASLSAFACAAGAVLTKNVLKKPDGLIKKCSCEQRDDMHKKLYFILICVCCIRAAMVAGFLHGIPEIRYENKYFHQGGDQAAYFAIAESLTHLQPIRHFLPVGFPLILTPFILAAHAAGWEDIVMPVLLFHTLLAMASIFIIGCLALQLTSSVAISTAAALAWALHPYLMYAGFGLHPNAGILRTIYVDHAMWFPMMSDPSSVFFMLLGLLLYVLSFENNRLGYSAGLAVGIATLIRTPNILIAFVFVAGYLFKKQYSLIARFALFVAAAMLPQLLYNMYCYGSPFDFGYAARKEVFSQAPLSFTYLINYVSFLSLTYRNLFALFLTVIVIAPCGALLFKKDRRFECSVVCILMWGYLLLYGMWHDFKCFPYRFLMPVIPLAVIIVLDFCSLVLTRLRKYLSSEKASHV